MMNTKRRVWYCIGFIVLIGVLFLLQFYFSHNYDEYGLLDRQYLGDLPDCQNCLIIETKNSQYSYFFGLYNVIDKKPKIYYFKNEHKLKNDLLNYSNNQSDQLIIKIHWNKINDWCCIKGVEGYRLCLKLLPVVTDTLHFATAKSQGMTHIS